MVTMMLNIAIFDTKIVTRDTFVWYNYVIRDLSRELLREQIAIDLV